MIKYDKFVTSNLDNLGCYDIVEYLNLNMVGIDVILFIFGKPQTHKMQN